ncbi:O-antigen ligase family protein [Clostridium psychrophilum]|uniref:O-antigen ligase family protein n=1 Tax=Clostridium psychrophilum TaxID=132926 RepID=UPI001C0DE4E0|nr:O-antigen ligase family protein [Clostridium psychrophilum]MBU3180281.1 O-antigen ligase family protein [Clostridium psychrophilum]
MKNYIAGVIIIFAIYLCFEESIVENILYKETIQKLLLLIILFCSIFNLILIKVNIGSNTIEIGLFSTVLFVYLYIFIIMYKKNHIKKSIDKKIILMIVCLTIINMYMLLEPIFLYIYSAQAYSMYLLIFFDIELMLLIFLVLRRFNYNQKIIISVVSVFSIMNGILGGLQYITNTVLINFKDPTQQLTQLYIGGRISGFVMGDNGGGTLGVIMFTVLLYKFNQNKNIFNISLILADVVFIIFTFTRVAYIAICVEILIFILSLIKIRSVKDLIKNIVAFSSVVGIGIYFYLNYFSKIVDILFLKRGDTQADRFVQFPLAIKAFLSTPILGTGHGQYNNYVLHKFGVIDQFVIHSQFLSMIVEEGIINFILFIVFNICLIYMLIKKYNKKKELLYIIMLVIGNTICINFNSNQTYEINICIYYLILFGFLFAKDEIKT